MSGSANKYEQFFLQVLSRESAKKPDWHSATHLPVSRSAKVLVDSGHDYTHTLLTSSANILGESGHSDSHLKLRLFA